MVILAGAENLVTLFIGLELLSIPLYVLCAAETRRATSLESGLKYLVIGSVGSATLLYGLALVYGAAGDTDFQGIADAVGDSVSVTDPLLLTGVALVVAGLAFKASVAPFHQWTPDVYQGAPTPVTAFMAVATKVAAFAILLRFLDHALPDAQTQWAPWLAVLAVTTIVIGNVGAIAQDSLKRMLAWSGVAQAGYLLAGVVVGTRLGLQAVCFYLIAYLFMNVAAFAVVAARERVSEHGDSLESLRDLGAAAPWLAWPMTIAMLSLAGFPATAGFIGQVLSDRRLRGRRLRLAGHRHRGRLDDLAGLLPARAGRDVDGQLLDRAAHAAAAHGQGRQGLVARGRRRGPARGGGGRRAGRRGHRGVRHHAVAAVRPVPRRGHVDQLDAVAGDPEVRRPGPVARVAGRRARAPPGRDLDRDGQEGLGHRVAADSRTAGRRRRREPAGRSLQGAPEIDYMGLSPVLALAGGAVLALIVALFPGRFVQRVLVPLVGAASLLTAGGLTIANWEAGDSTRSSPARWPSTRWRCC